MPGAVGLPKLSRRKAAVFLPLSALLALLGVVLYGPAVASRSADYSRLPELFVMAAVPVRARAGSAMGRATSPHPPTTKLG